MDFGATDEIGRDRKVGKNPGIAEVERRVNWAFRATRSPFDSRWISQSSESHSRGISGINSQGDVPRGDEKKKLNSRGYTFTAGFPAKRHLHFARPELSTSLFSLSLSISSAIAFQHFSFGDSLHLLNYNPPGLSARDYRAFHVAKLHDALFMHGVCVCTRARTRIPLL